MNPYRGWCPIVGSNHSVNNGQPVGELVSLLENDGTFFTIPSHASVALRFSQELGFPADVHSHISRSSLAGIIEAIRNTVLDWALKLEGAGVRGDGLSFSKVEANRAREVTINIGSIGNAVGLGSFGSHTSINATQTLTSGELAAAVEKLVAQIERLLPGSDLLEDTKREAKVALKELRDAATDVAPDAGRLRRGLDALKHIMEHAAGHILGAGILAMIGQIHPAL